MAERTNDDRVTDGTYAVLGYLNRTGGTMPTDGDEFTTAAGDLVADILHAVANLHGDTETVLRRAEMHYSEEAE